MFCPSMCHVAHQDRRDICHSVNLHLNIRNNSGFKHVTILRLYTMRPSISSKYLWAAMKKKIKYSFPLMSFPFYLEYNVLHFGFGRYLVHIWRAVRLVKKWSIGVDEIFIHLFEVNKCFNVSVIMSLYYRFVRHSTSFCWFNADIFHFKS